MILNHGTEWYLSVTQQPPSGYQESRIKFHSLWTQCSDKSMWSETRRCICCSQCNFLLLCQSSPLASGKLAKLMATHVQCWVRLHGHAGVYDAHRYYGSQHTQLGPSSLQFDNVFSTLHPFSKSSHTCWAIGGVQHQLCTSFTMS